MKNCCCCFYCWARDVNFTARSAIVYRYMKIELKRPRERKKRRNFYEMFEKLISIFSRITKSQRLRKIYISCDTRAHRTCNTRRNEREKMKLKNIERSEKKSKQNWLVHVIQFMFRFLNAKVHRRCCRIKIKTIILQLPLIGS